MRSTRFEHDALVVHVGNVNPRTEKHGEEEKLAVDVSLRLMEPNDWTPVLEELLGDEQASDDWVQANQEIADRVNFAATYEDHKVNFRVSTETLASLPFCKINKFSMDFVDIGMTLRLQAETDGDTVGSLSELIHQLVRLEVVGPDQMDAFDAEEGEE